MYRVSLSDLSSMNYGTCYRHGIRTTYTEIPEDPPPSGDYGYLVTAEFPDGEGLLGMDSDNRYRPNNYSCP